VLAVFAEAGLALARIGGEREHTISRVKRPKTARFLVEEQPTKCRVRLAETLQVGLGEGTAQECATEELHPLGTLGLAFPADHQR